MLSGTDVKAQRTDRFAKQLSEHGRMRIDGGAGNLNDRRDDLWRGTGPFGVVGTLTTCRDVCITPDLA
jgi:hypothetical protein